ncbi:MAG: alpha/beta fold hydrolase [Streptosporangiales bacterium]|nr:alpha/beta fold hydrolase [Streptosporangiales bacterium]
MNGLALHRAGYVPTSLGRCFVEVAGEGPAVLLLHTAGQSGVQWEETLRRLPTFGFTAVVPDLPGHGRSDPARGGPVEDVDGYRRACEEIAAGLGLECFYVAGVSVGGKLALDFAVHGDGRVLGVVACGAEAYNRKQSASGLRRAREGSASPSAAERTYYGTLASVGSSVPADRAELIAARHRREDPLVTATDLGAWAVHDLRGRLGKVRCPVHLVAGAEDFWIDLDDVRATAAEIPGARVTVLDGVGHYPMEELPDFPERLAAWLRELEEAR